MPDDAILLTENDLRPLTGILENFDAGIDAVARATRALHGGSVKHAAFLGAIQPSGRPSVRLTMATGAGLHTGVRLFGTLAPDHLGLERAVNTRCYLLLDGATGQVLALMDYGRLNPLRVGAVGGLAARHLAPSGARTLAMLGSGQLTRAQVPSICRAVPSITKVLVYSPTREHREGFAREMSAWLGIAVEAVDTVGEATRDADIVDLANGSPVPILERSQVKPGALVIATTEGQLAPDLFSGSRVVFSTWESIADNALTREPYTSRIKAGTFTRNDLAAELTTVLAGEATPRRSDDDVVLFELTALHVHDLAIAEWAYAWARANGVGTPFVLSTS